MVRKLIYLIQAFQYPFLFDSWFLAVETVKGKVAEIPTYIPLETENRTAPKRFLFSFIQSTNFNWKATMPDTDLFSVSFLYSKPLLAKGFLSPPSHSRHSAFTLLKRFGSFLHRNSSPVSPSVNAQLGWSFTCKTLFSSFLKINPRIEVYFRQNRRNYIMSVCSCYCILVNILMTGHYSIMCLSFWTFNQNVAHNLDLFP